MENRNGRTVQNAAKSPLARKKDTDAPQQVNPNTGSRPSYFYTTSEVVWPWVGAKMGIGSRS